MVNAKKKSSGKTRSTDEVKFFEFYRVFSYSNNGCRVEPCSPLHKRATYDTLSEVCAVSYGAGGFVALEVGESAEGLPLSYWIIKVLEIDRRVAKRVYLSDEEKKHQRRLYYLIPSKTEGVLTLDEGRDYHAAHPWWDGIEGLRLSEHFKNPSSWQRATEAAFVASQLKSLSNPRTKKQLVQLSNEKESAQVARARELQAQGYTRKGIIDTLYAERKEYWPKDNNDAGIRRNCELAYDALQKSNLRHRKKKQVARRKKPGEPA